MTESITAYADQSTPLKLSGFSLDFLRSAFLKRIGSLQDIHLRVVESGRETILLGDDSEPRFDIVIHDPLFYAYACLNGSIGVGEAYMLGLWESDDRSKSMSPAVKMEPLSEGR